LAILTRFVRRNYIRMKFSSTAKPYVSSRRGGGWKKAVGIAMLSIGLPVGRVGAEVKGVGDPGEVNAARFDE
jgi:hypothetical protein